MKTNPGILLATLLVTLGLLTACNGGGGGAPASSATAITAQPTDQSVVAGTTATFDVVASNATGYQWHSSTDGGANFIAVAGATSTSYTTPVTALADTGTQYRVAVSGAKNSVTSSAVTLTVTPIPVAPSISVHPTGQTITAGQDASFTVTASGTSLGYQWQRSTDGGANFADVSGATNATLTLTVVPLADNAHQFRVVVSNSAGSVTSNAALLTVNVAQSTPAFTSHPASVSVLTPNTATFTVVVTGIPSPTLQWQLSTNAGGSFADIVGATGGSYTTVATSAGDNGNQYRVIATNTAGSTTSNVATLTVTVPAAPSFTTQLTNVTITEGQNAQFTVAVSGTPTPTLQWQLSTDSGGTWNNITGETGTVFNVTGAALANNGRQFRVVASNSVSTVNSNAAVLTVTAAPPADKAWQTAELIETGDAGEAFLPQIAVNAQGEAIAVWQQSDGVSIDIYANRYTPGSGWGTAQLIETNNDGVAQNAQVAIDSSGNALAVWQQRALNGRDDIWANRYTVGIGWGAAIVIDNGFFNAGNPQIAIDGSGTAIAVWWQSESDFGLASMVANRYVVGSGWGTAAVIENDGTGHVSAPQIAMDSAGNAVVVWAWGTIGGYNIWANRYVAGTGAGTGWGSAAPIDSVNTGTATPTPHVAMDGTGNAIAVWHRPDGGWDSIWANRYAAGSGWGTSVLVETDNTNSARNARVAFDASGNAFAVWTQSFGGVANVMANRYAAGAGWGTAVLIETDNAGPAIEPRLVVDASGNATAVWSQQNIAGFTFNIWTNRFTAGAGWGGARTIDNNPSPARDPQIGVDASGNVVSVWHQYSGGVRPSIWANTFR